MARLILCFALSFFCPPSDRSVFTIERTEVHSDYGSIYILMLANQIVPPDKASSKSEIACLVREVKESGIFSDVRTRLLKSSNGGGRILTISATPKPNWSLIIIDEVSATGFAHVDDNQFQLALKRNGVTRGQSLANYSLNQLMEKVTHSLQSLSGASEVEKAENPWITIRPAGKGRVKIILSPAYQGCGRSSREATPDFGHNILVLEGSI